MLGRPTLTHGSRGQMDDHVDVMQGLFREGSSLNIPLEGLGACGVVHSPSQGSDVVTFCHENIAKRPSNEAGGACD